MVLSVRPLVRWLNPPCLLIKSIDWLWCLSWTTPITMGRLIKHFSRKRRLLPPTSKTEKITPTFLNIIFDLYASNLAPWKNLYNALHSSCFIRSNFTTCSLLGKLPLQHEAFVLQFFVLFLSTVTLPEYCRDKNVSRFKTHLQFLN